MRSSSLLARVMLILICSIETSEFDMMDDLIKYYDGRPLPFGQLLIELHAWKWTHPKANKLVRWFENLERAGLRPFMAEPNLGELAGAKESNCVDNNYLEWPRITNPHLSYANIPSSISEESMP